MIMDLETKALKAVDRVVRLKHVEGHGTFYGEGGANGGELNSTYSINSVAEVRRLVNFFGAGEGRVDSLSVPYMSAAGLALYPRGYDGPVYVTESANAAGRRSEDLSDWMDEFAPKKKPAKKSAKRPAAKRKAAKRKAAKNKRR